MCQSMMGQPDVYACSLQRRQQLSRRSSMKLEPTSHLSCRVPGTHVASHLLRLPASWLQVLKLQAAKEAAQAKAAAGGKKGKAKKK